MPDELQEAVCLALASACGLERGARLVVGVSGGPDSLTLLHALHALGFEVIAAHLHHGLREAADADAAAVEAVARRLGVPLVVGRDDVAALAAAGRQSLEDAAREARYRFLFRVAREQRAVAVTVGHTADDQSETVLMHLLRGSGLTGLAGLRPCRRLPRWDAEIPLARPLLGVRRTATIAYARRYGLPLRWDASNWQRAFFRNRLRLDLLPRLRVENPALDAALGRLAAVAAAEEDFLAAEARRRLTAVLVAEDDKFVGLQRQAFLAAPLALQRRWLRWAAARLGAPEVGFEHVEAARRASAYPGGGARDWFAGLVLWVEPATLWVAQRRATLPAEAWPQLPGEQAFPLEPGGSVALASGWVLTLSALSPPPDDPHTSPATAWLDASALAFPLMVRPRRPGDAIAPLGMGGRRQKIADLMVNAKIPPRLRARWPLVVSGEEIVWVPLLAVAHPARITAATTAAVSLSLRRNA